MALEPGKTKPEIGAADGALRLCYLLAELFGHVVLIVGMACVDHFAVISMVELNALLMGYRHAQESECYKGKQQTGLCGGKQL